MGLRSFIKSLFTSAQQNGDGYFRARETEDDAIWSAIAQAERQGAYISPIQKAKIEEFLRCRQILEESMEIARKTENKLTRESRLEVARSNLERIESLEKKYDVPVKLETAGLWAEYYCLSGMAETSEQLPDHQSRMEMARKYESRTARRPTAHELKLQRYREDLQKELDDLHNDNPADLTAFIGRPWGEIVAELTGGANLVDGKQCWELAETHKHDLPVMLSCCHAQLRTMEQAGQMPAPFYFERAAILFRKKKKYKQEVQVIELYLDAIKAWNEANGNTRPNGGGARHLKIVARLDKAKQLAAKHPQNPRLASA